MPSLPPVFDNLQKGSEKAWGSYHVIQGTDDITGSRHEDIFIFISLAAEKFHETRQAPAERQVLPLEFFAA